MLAPVASSESRYELLVKTACSRCHVDDQGVPIIRKADQRQLQRRDSGLECRARRSVEAVKVAENIAFFHPGCLASTCSPTLLQLPVNIGSDLAS